jgi:hypothetical protein
MGGYPDGNGRSLGQTGTSAAHKNCHREGMGQPGLLRCANGLHRKGMGHHL